MGQAFGYLEEYPEIHDRMLTDAKFRETAIDEFVRYYSPTPRTPGR